MPKYKSDITLYIPVYKVNKDGKEFPYYPTFSIEHTMASTDEQLVASLNPDEILVVKGEYDWNTDK